MRKGRSDVMALVSQDFGHSWFQCCLLLPRVRTRTIAASCQRWLQSAPPRLSCSGYTWTRAVSSLFVCLVRFCSQCRLLFGYTNLSEWESWLERQQNKVISKQYTLKVWEQFYLFQSRSVISSRLLLTKVHFFASGLEARSAPNSVLSVRLPERETIGEI